MAEFHIGPLICGVRATVMEMTKERPLELPPFRKTTDQEQYHIPGGLQR